MMFPLAMVGFSPEQEQHLRPHLVGAHLSDFVNDPPTLALLQKQELAPFDLTRSPLLERLFPISDPPTCLFVPIYVAHHLAGLLGVTFSRA